MYSFFYIYTFFLYALACFTSVLAQDTLQTPKNTPITDTKDHILLKKYDKKYFFKSSIGNQFITTSINKEDFGRKLYSSSNSFLAFTLDVQDIALFKKKLTLSYTYKYYIPFFTHSKHQKNTNDNQDIRFSTSYNNRWYFEIYHLDYAGASFTNNLLSESQVRMSGLNTSFILGKQRFSLDAVLNQNEQILQEGLAFYTSLLLNQQRIKGIVDNTPILDEDLYFIGNDWNMLITSPLFPKTLPKLSLLMVASIGIGTSVLSDVSYFKNISLSVYMGAKAKVLYQFPRSNLGFHFDFNIFSSKNRNEYIFNISPKTFSLNYIHFFNLLKKK